MTPLLWALVVVVWMACGYLAVRLRAAFGDAELDIYAASFFCGPISLVLMGLAAIVAHAVVSGQKAREGKDA